MKIKLFAEGNVKCVVKYNSLCLRYSICIKLVDIWKTITACSMCCNIGCYFYVIYRWKLNICIILMHTNLLMEIQYHRFISSAIFLFISLVAYAICCPCLRSKCSRPFTLRSRRLFPRRASREAKGLGIRSPCFTYLWSMGIHP